MNIFLLLGFYSCPTLIFCYLADVLWQAIFSCQMLSVQLYLLTGHFRTNKTTWSCPNITSWIPAVFLCEYSLSVHQYLLCLEILRLVCLMIRVMRNALFLPKTWLDRQVNSLEWTAKKKKKSFLSFKIILKGCLMFSEILLWYLVRKWKKIRTTAHNC